jgi:hypothetical protein
MSPIDRRETLLKKAGIVAAAATAGLLAVSPLAFAHGGGRHHSNGNVQSGLINLQNTNVQIPVQLCNNSILEGTLGVLAKDQKNKDSHKGHCKQDNKADNS